MKATKENKKDASPEVIPCSLKLLPEDQWILASETAIRINPENKRHLNQLRQALGSGVIPPAHLALLIPKRWPPTGVSLTVSFLGTVDAALQTRILSHMNAWGQYCNATFTLVNVNGQVRISLTGAGYWSYLGTDITHIAAGQATMNLQGFSMSTPESEFHRVVRHETGHTLGFPHEHTRSEIVNRIDPAKAKAYFLANDGWDAAMVTAQVLTPLNDSALIETAHADPNSIMCYWLPASIMKDNIAVAGGMDIDIQDAQFASTVYPKIHGGGGYQTMGAITVDGSRPYVFVKCNDGNLWVYWWSGSAWAWSNQGTPSGVTLTDKMGAITVDGGRPYVFVKGSDGNLWVNWWSGSAWGWSNQGKPAGVTIAATMGAINVDAGRPYVFIKGSDGNLWVNWWSGTAWGWANQGKPSGLTITDSMGAITVDGGRPYVFVKCSDGHLWVNWWSGTAWKWANQGTPPGGVSITNSEGAINVDAGRPYVFVRGSDGNLWVNWWSGTAWAWANQHKPSGLSITDSMGAITVDGGRPYVFVKCSDGNLWVNWWSGSAWAWANQGTPPSGVSITNTMGAITVGGGRPYVFVKGSDGNLWINWWSGTAWAWSKAN